MFDLGTSYMMEAKSHIPVMLNEVLGYLNLKPGQTIVDATIGTGGHSQKILERISVGVRLIGIDRDAESLDIARERLKEYSNVCNFIHGNFSDIDVILESLNVRKIDGILLDLGVSSFQLDNPSRGFSFQNEGPLDMRLDRNNYISAYDLLNNLNEDEISTLLWNFGQEKWHNRIARLLVKEREKHPIATTKELSNIVVRAIPPKYRHYRIHPATRTFQAVRIAVNRELENIEKGINKMVDFLNPGARMCVISFHSLEDRIVKFSFRNFQSLEKIRIITPKPLTPTPEEIKENPSSRSARLRVAERI